MRSVPEWIGKDDNTAIPARVKLRIFRVAAGTCAICGHGVSRRGGAEFDHIRAISLGGANAEHNLQLSCLLCHKEKTRADVKQKSKDNRVMSKHVGITGPKQKIASRGFPKRPPQNTASRPLERRS